MALCVTRHRILWLPSDTSNSVPESADMSSGKVDGLLSLELKSHHKYFCSLSRNQVGTDALRHDSVIEQLPWFLSLRKMSKESKDGQEHHRHQKFHPGTTVTVALFSPNAQVPRWGQVDPEERHKQNLSPKSELDLAHSMFLYFEFLLQGLRINMELFMKFFRWQRSLRTEGIEGTGGCINNSIALCQRTSFANSSAPFSISSSALSASKHSFTRAQIEGFWCRVSFLLVGVVARRSWWPERGTLREDRPDPIWVPERLVRRVQQSPWCQDETSDTDDVPVRPTGESE
ncbi:hypothetical protein STEG23_012589 [Scotinomys teguina]